MIEQKVIIHLTDENLNELGTLTVSSLDYRGDNESKIKLNACCDKSAIIAEY